MAAGAVGTGGGCEAGADGHVQARGADGRGRCTSREKESATSAQEPAASGHHQEPALGSLRPRTCCSRNELALATELQSSGT